MMRFMEILSFLLAWGYTFVFFMLLKTLLPLRKNKLMAVAAFIGCGYLADAIVYSNDLYGLLGIMVGFFVYILIFFCASLIEKISVLLVFYPALIAVNYLMMDIGGRIFYAIAQTTYEEVIRSPRLMFISTAIHTFSLFLRLLFWIGMWCILRKFLWKITSHLNTRMWLIIDMLMLASFVAIFTIIYFMPEDAMIVYPICGASIFSSFGCMYLASYICESMQMAYRVQELERQSNYYKDQIKDEERIRSIYHDLKNHLLVWQSEAGGSQKTIQSIQMLQTQIEGYETYQHTGNEVLDIIIRDKAKLAQERQIDFNAVIAFEDGSFMEAMDISTIFGNALDNAIEASEKLPKDQRLITVKANRVRDLMAIVVENTALTEGVSLSRTTKKDKFLHGFGLPNIKKAAERYEGQCSIKAENGIFVLKIMIPIPSFS